MNSTTQTPPSIASTFEALVYTVRTYPESSLADIHAVNLVSQLAAMPERKACVAIVCSETFSRYVGLERSIYLLQDYGVTLLQRWVKSKPAFFVFAELDDDADPDPFAGATVMVHDAAHEPQVITTFKKAA